MSKILIDEATAKLVLEALELVIADVKTTPSAYEAQRQAITALETELAKPDFWEGYVPEPVKPSPVPWSQALEDVWAEQPAQQEPVQRYSPDGEGGMEIDSLGAWVKFTSPPAQRKPLTVEELKAKWNAQSDHMNQWEELGLDEIVLFAQEGDL